jgi:hypothetical protein
METVSTVSRTVATRHPGQAVEPKFRRWNGREKAQNEGCSAGSAAHVPFTCQVKACPPPKHESHQL